VTTNAVHVLGTCRKWKNREIEALLLPDTVCRIKLTASVTLMDGSDRSGLVSK